jgi:hypothetical protein
MSPMKNRLILTGLFVTIAFSFCWSMVLAQTPRVRKPKRPLPYVGDAAHAKIIVGRNVMVSAGSPGWEHAEYVADADPTDPNRVMVCSMRFSQAKNQLATGIYVTFDGGKNWMLGYNDTSSRFLGVWDPACGYGMNHQALLVTLVENDTAPRSPGFLRYETWKMGGDRQMHVYRSSDGGRTWDIPTELSAIDREDLKTDDTDGPYRGRMYLYGGTEDPAALWLVYSIDGGRTWARSIKTEVEGSAEEYGSGTILPDGTLLLPYRLNHKSQTNGPEITSIAVAASTDGGVHIDLPIAVAPSVPRGQESCDSGIMGMASDHSLGPFRARAYVTWAEKQRGRCYLFVSYSDNKGKIWSTPTQVRDVEPHRLATPVSERLMPQIAVNKKGIIGVTWYDTDEGTSRPAYRLRFTASLDGGETWVRSVPVSARPFVVKEPPELAAQAFSSGGGRRMEPKRTDVADVLVYPSARSYYTWNGWPGDYVGIAAGADGVFHTFWIANRTGVGELYTAPIIVRGTVFRRGSKDLEQLENVTSALEFQYTSSVWNPKTKIVSLEFHLLNTSDRLIEGPLKVRIVRLESDLGMPMLVLTDGSSGGPGTVLDLSRMISPGGLAPGQITKSQKLRVKFDKVSQLRGIQQRDIVHMKLKVYGTRRKVGSSFNKSGFNDKNL